MTGNFLVCPMEGIQTAIDPPSSPRWPDLSEELLHEIFTRVSSPDDQARFGLVCQSWRSIRNYYPPPPLVVDFSHHFFNFSYLSQDDGHPSDITLRLTLREPRKYYPSFSRGWLTLLNLKERCAHLVNPLSYVWIRLPTLPAPHLLDVALSNLSPTANDFVVIGYYKFYIKQKVVDMLSWCKPGDDTWTEIDRLPNHARSMAIHKGRVYVLLKDCNTNVYSLEDSYPKRRRRDPVVQWFAEVHFPLTQVYQNLRLAESGGDLLLVVKFYARRSRNVPEFELFRLENGIRWARCRDIGDRVLLLSKYGLDSVCSREVGGWGFRSNCIYELEGDGYLSVYSLEDGKYCFRGTYDNWNESFAAWFLPQQW